MNDTEQNNNDSPQLPKNFSRMMLEPLNHGLAAAERQCLKQGVPGHEVINLLLNHMASVCAMVEPAQAREILIKDLVSSFSGMVRKHVEARYTTSGGVVLPGIGP